MSADDAKLIEWKRSNLPNLMRSEVGKWMLENKLMEYYSEPMQKDLQQAANVGKAEAGTEATPAVSGNR
jgi:hypothetical protein